MIKIILSMKNKIKGEHWVAIVALAVGALAMVLIYLQNNPVQVKTTTNKSVEVSAGR